MWLAEQGLIVDTLDLSAAGVAKARALAAARGVTINAPANGRAHWTWPREKYDLVALIYLHLVAPDRRRLHAEAFAALKPGGLIVLEAFRPEQIERQKQGVRGGPRDVELLYPLDAIVEDFRGVDVVFAEEADEVLSEGTLHQGASAVARLIARNP